MVYSHRVVDSLAIAASSSCQRVRTASTFKTR
nr:MAG TPA: hypothetical protein [Bacteriophage sp.]